MAWSHVDAFEANIDQSVENATSLVEHAGLIFNTWKRPDRPEPSARAGRVLGALEWSATAEGRRCSGVGHSPRMGHRGR